MFHFSIIYGNNPSQLTNSYFSRWLKHVLKPPASIVFTSFLPISLMLRSHGSRGLGVLLVHGAARGIAQARGTMVDGLEHVELEWLDVDL